MDTHDTTIYVHRMLTVLRSAPKDIPTVDGWMRRGDVIDLMHTDDGTTAHRNQYAETLAHRAGLIERDRDILPGGDGRIIWWRITDTGRRFLTRGSTITRIRGRAVIIPPLTGT